jgi:hypothetical protein
MADSPLYETSVLDGVGLRGDHVVLDFRRYVTGVISSLISRVSAALLAVSGGALLFAPDVLLPALVLGFPPTAAWLGQLLGAAWLGVAALNWLNRATILGGIYGRPVVLANLALYLVSALSLLRVVADGAAPRAIWAALLPATALAALYGALLLRGPFDLLRPPAS